MGGKKQWILGWSMVVGFYVLGNLIYDSVTIHNLQAEPVLEGPAVSYYLSYEIGHLAVIFLYWGIGVIVLHIIEKTFKQAQKRISE